MALRQKDYILKLLEQFYAALDQLLYGKSDEEIPFSAVEDKLFTSYLENDAYFFHLNSSNNIIQYIQTKFPEKEQVARLEIASELLYQDFLHNQTIDKSEVKDKLLELYSHLDNLTKTFSIDREEKRDILNNF